MPGKMGGISSRPCALQLAQQGLGIIHRSERLAACEGLFGFFARACLVPGFGERGGKVEADIRRLWRGIDRLAQ